MAFFFHQLLQLIGHFIKINRQVGQFVLAFAHIALDARIQIARSQGAKALLQDADGLGNVVCQDIGSG